MSYLSVSMRLLRVNYDILLSINNYSTVATTLLLMLILEIDNCSMQLLVIMTIYNIKSSMKTLISTLFISNIFMFSNILLWVNILKILLLVILMFFIVIPLWFNSIISFIWFSLFCICSYVYTVMFWMLTLETADNTFSNFGFWICFIRFRVCSSFSLLFCAYI